MQTRSTPNWQTAKLPANTAFFAIGDIHGHAGMLKQLLSSIEKNISEMPSAMKIHVIGIGDYIDRGENAPETLELLRDFRARMARNHPNVETHFLCGNHDLCFKYILDAKYVTQHTSGDAMNRDDRRHHLVMEDGGLPLSGLVDWMDSGGGITTIKNYCPNLKEGFLERCRLGGNIAEVNDMLAELKHNMPEAHKQFFKEVSEHTHLILGDYLFTHAGVDPEKSLDEQGMVNGKLLAPLDKMQMVDPENRNKFLWRDQLDHCPYVVVHGHTPSAIDGTDERGTPMTVVDPQKPYRLCLDTGVYNPKGALTCMMRAGNETGFLAVSHADPSYVSEYSLNIHAMEHARDKHRAKLPEYHPGGEKYYGSTSAAQLGL